MQWHHSYLWSGLNGLRFSKNVLYRNFINKGNERVSLLSMTIDTMPTHYKPLHQNIKMGHFVTPSFSSSGCNEFFLFKTKRKNDESKQALLLLTVVGCSNQPNENVTPETKYKSMLFQE